MIRKKLGLAFAASAVLLLASNGSAITLTAGDLEFGFGNYDSGTVGYGPPPLGIVCNSAATCDAAALLPAPGAIGSEDTWGIFSISTITNITTGDLLYFTGKDGKFLTGVFGGITDGIVETSTGIGGDRTVALANGGFLKLYENAVNYNPDPNGDTNGPGGRIGLTGYKGISDLGGALLLDAVFAGSALNGLPYSYVSDFLNQGTSGNGQGYLDVVGGQWQTILDTDSLPDTAGVDRDLFLTVTFDDVTGDAGAIGWTVTSEGQVKGAVPTPVPLALLGLGLAGIGIALGRKARTTRAS